MRKLLTKRNILTVCFSLMMLVSAAFAVVFAQSSLTARAEGEWDVSLSLRNDLVLQVTPDGDVEEMTAYVLDEDGTTHLNEATLTKNEQGAFEYHGITPQLMSNTVYLTAGDVTKTFTVVDYCNTFLDGNKSDFGLTSAQMGALKTLAVDILKYGEAAQNFDDYNTENLATAGLTEEELALGGTYDLPESVKRSTAADTSGIYIRGAGVRFDNNAGLYFTVVVPEGTDMGTLSLKLNNETLTNFAATEEANVYTVLYEGQYVAEYGETVTAQVYQDDAAVGNEVTYSVNSYVAEMADDGTMGALVKSLYAFNQSALAYENADATKSVDVTGYDLMEENGNVYFVVNGTQNGYTAADITVDYNVTMRKYDDGDGNADNNPSFSGDGIGQANWKDAQISFSADGNEFTYKINLTAELETPNFVAEYGNAELGEPADQLNRNVFAHIYVAGSGWNTAVSPVSADIPGGETIRVYSDGYMYEVGNLENWGQAIVRVYRPGEDVYTTISSNSLVAENNVAYWVITGEYEAVTLDGTVDEEISVRQNIENIEINMQLMGGTWPYAQFEKSVSVDATANTWIMKLDLSKVNADPSPYFMHFKYSANTNPDGNYYAEVETGAVYAAGKRYELLPLSGSGDNAWRTGLAGLYVADNYYEVTNISVVGENEKTYFVLEGNGDVARIQAEFYFDLESNGSFSGNSWIRHNLTNKSDFTGSDVNAGTFVIKIDITDVVNSGETAFTGHIFAGDRNLSFGEGYGTDADGKTFDVNGKRFTLVYKPGSNEGTEFWGAVGLMISDIPAA